MVDFSSLFILASFHVFVRDVYFEWQENFTSNRMPEVQSLVTHGRFDKRLISLIHIFMFYTRFYRRMLYFYIGADHSRNVTSGAFCKTFEIPCPIKCKCTLKPRSHQRADQTPLWKNARITNERALIGESVCWSKIQRGLDGPPL